MKFVVYVNDRSAFVACKKDESKLVKNLELWSHNLQDFNRVVVNDDCVCIEQPNVSLGVT